MPQETPCVSRIIYDRHFLIKLTQFEKKTGSIGNFFYSSEKSEHQNILSKLEVDHVFVTFRLSLFDSGVFLPFNNGNEANLKLNQTSNREMKLESGQIFHVKKTKKNINTY